MNPAGPMLRDIHLPPAAWWPPAPGWWLLAALVLLLIAAIVWWRRWRARRRPLTAALGEIDRIATAFDHDGDVATLADGASRLLRRVARRIESSAASRDGEAWRTFVHAHALDAATRTALDDLIAARFRAHPVLDGPALLAAMRAWCRRALRAPHPNPLPVEERETSAQRLASKGVIAAYDGDEGRVA